MDNNRICNKSFEGIHWNLSTFIGCNGIVISHNSYIRNDLRGNGLGNKEHENRILISQILGYSCMLCTVKSDNEIQKKILTKYEWTKIHEFYNKYTKNGIEIWAKNLD